METLIINKRHELPLRKKIVWDIVTVLLWTGWIYLWKPFFHVIHKILTLDAKPNEIADVIMDNIHVIPVYKALIMLITTPLILFILSRINRYRAPSTHLIYDSSEYASYFGVDNVELEHCRNSQLVTVYHNEHGQITALKDHVDLN
jgi:poly-beta-1,6-N-acetyl-D-glucosamine biosynthesis protein PgaD